MRHNITKKVISAMLSGALMLSLAGCGKAAKLPSSLRWYRKKQSNFSPHMEIQQNLLWL